MPFLEKHANVGGRLPGGIETAATGSWEHGEYIPGPASRDALQHLPKNNTGRQTCGNPECTGSWKLPWKNRRRPIFEGHWGCSTRCLEAVIRRSLRRERSDLRPAMEEGAPHRHRIPLGLVMLSQGLITQSQLRIALAAQRSAGQGRIGQWLVQECGLHPAQITRGLAVQWSCPILPSDGFTPATMALTAPRLFMEEFGLLPLRIAASRILYLAFSDRLNATAAFAIEQMSGLKVESGLLDDIQFQHAHSRILESPFVPMKQVSFIDIETLATKIASVLDQSQPVGSRLVRVHQHYWLRMWLETGAYSGVGSLPGTDEDVIDTVFTFAGSSSGAPHSLLRT